MKLDWPESNPETGKPVTTATNQSILLAAAQAAAGEHPDSVQAFQDSIEACTTNWRKDYIPIFKSFVELQATASPGTVVKMCQAGLDKAESSFVFRDDNEDSEEKETMSLKSFFEKQTLESNNFLKTSTYAGKQPVKLTTSFELASPHGTDENPVWVTGNDAVAQIDAWKNYGCMEPSAASHATAVCKTESVSEYVSDKTFCLLGVTSEMGPAYHLLKIPGSNVMGVARGGSKLDKLTTWFQQHGPESATLQVPTGGANLLEQGPEIARWILATANASKPLVIMPLAYMDGEANVRVTMAMDAILKYVMSQRTDVSLAYLTSPTTIYTIPKEAAEDAKQRYESSSSSPVNKLVAMVSAGYLLQPSNAWKQLESEDNNNKDPVVVYNGAFHLQGPNYLLAKTMQQWRCIVEHAAGVRVCAPHAPGTRTWSVLHNPDAATAMEGQQYFAPLLTFDVQPCSSLLTAIILNQLKGGERDKTTLSSYNHPLELFWDGSVHGGGWRCPYTFDSIVALTYVLGKTIAKKGWCPEAALAPKPAGTAPAH